MKITKDLIKYDIETAVIKALDDKYKDVQITDGKTYVIVIEGLREYRKLRLKIDDKHKDLKKDVLEYGRAVDAEKNRLKALLEPGENHLKQIRQIEDDRKEAIKGEKEAKERERIEIIQEKINSIRSMGIVGNITSSAIKERLTFAENIAISGSVYMEFTEQAMQAHETTVNDLKGILTERLQVEKEDAERKAEAERLEKVRKEQAIAQAKIDEENRKIQAEKDKLEAEKEAERKRKEKEEFEHQAKIEAERKAKEKIEQENRERTEREEAEAKEKARQEALKPDKEKLIKFADKIYDIEIPVVESKKVQKIALEARNILGELAQDIRAKAKKL